MFVTFQFTNSPRKRTQEEKRLKRLFMYTLYFIVLVIMYLPFMN